MKNTIVAISFFALSTVIGAQVVEQGFWVADPKGNLRAQLSRQKELVIDHASSLGFEVYGPTGTGQYLKQLGVDYVELDNNKDLLADYPTSAQITQMLQQLAQRQPQYVSLTSIGKSHKGNDLWVVKLSDNVTRDELEPEVKYIANMHGNEIVGRELMVLLLKDLVQGIEQKNPRIMKLLSEHEVFILPSMNPDGADMKQRGNARSIDLNRNFPDFTTRDSRNEPGTREPETRAVMAWQGQRHFVLSANFHGGAVVVNYPWDTTPDTHPHEEHVVALAKDYADIVPDMRGSSEFPGGIVNGYRWYEVDGGMQDWSYYWYGDLQFTMEVSDPKWPSYSDIPNYYNAHKEALLQFLEQGKAGFGLHAPNGVSRATVAIRSKTRNWQLQRQFDGQEMYFSLAEDSYVIDVKFGTESRQFNVEISKQSVPQYFTL